MAAPYVSQECVQHLREGGLFFSPLGGKEIEMKMD